MRQIVIYRQASKAGCFGNRTYDQVVDALAFSHGAPREFMRVGETKSRLAAECQYAVLPPDDDCYAKARNPVGLRLRLDLIEQTRADR